MLPEMRKRCQGPFMSSSETLGVALRADIHERKTVLMVVSLRPNLIAVTSPRFRAPSPTSCQERNSIYKTCPDKEVHIQVKFSAGDATYPALSKGRSVRSIYRGGCPNQTGMATSRIYHFYMKY